MTADAQPQKRGRGRPRKHPIQSQGGKSWWIDAPPHFFTARCVTEWEDHMRTSREQKLVSGAIQNDCSLKPVKKSRRTALSYWS